jgi:putative DNA primase/helicase
MFSIDINKRDKDGVIKNKYSGFPKNWQNLTESKIENDKNGVAILTGKVNNVIVIDFDKEEGLYYFNKYKHLFEDTFIEDSTNGYKHAYFTYDEDFKSGVSKLSNKIDILSNGKCCVMGKINNMKKTQKMDARFKYLLLNGEDNDNYSNISTQSETESNISTHSNQSDINFDNYEELCEMLYLLPESFYNDYKSWIDCGMSINNITNTQGFKIWEHFSKVKNYKKFIKNSEYQMISTWNKFEVKEYYGMDVFFNYIINTGNDELIKKLNHFKVKYNYIIDKNPDNINYFIEDDFYFRDLEEYLVSTTFKSYNDILIYLKDNLHRVFAQVNNNLIVEKTNDDVLYNLKPFEKAGLKLIIITYIQDNKTKKTTLYDIILNNKKLFYLYNNTKTDFDFSYSNKKCFYMSREFIATELDKYDMTVIDEVLSFIKEVFCKNDEVIYDYFMKWLAFTVKYPNMKSGKGILLYSEPRCGKGTIIEFLCKYIYGDYNTIPNIGLKGLLDKNNYQLLGKKFIAVNELSTVKEEFKSKFDTLKTFITESKQPFKKLYCDTGMADFYTEFLFMTNNKYSFSIEEKDGRYLMLDCSSKYRGNNEYFSKFRSKYFNKNTGDHFYTYLLSLLTKPDDFYMMKLPDTQYKKDLKNISKHSIIEYIEFLLEENNEYFKSKENTTSWTSDELDKYIEPNKFGRFKKADLYQHYSKWLELNGERKQANKWFKVNLLDNGFVEKKSNGIRYYEYVGV